MANTHVFTGMDGAISVAVESGVEGDAAKAVNDTYSLTPVGRATSVAIEVESAMKPFHELGQRYATELRPGNVNISGTIGRAHINGALLKLFPGNTSTVTVHSVKLDGWNFSLPEDDFVLEEVSFKALWISVEDAGT